MTERWTLDSILRVTTDFFADKGIRSARLDAELLLCRVLGLSRVQLYTHYDRPISESERETYRELVRRRANLEPVAYILGEREFYGRRFAVGAGVLVPRPETEHLIDAVLDELRGAERPRILDVGTGSGAIAATLALELEAAVVACDVDDLALRTARDNAQSLGANVEILKSDLFAAIGTAKFDAILSNPPYIPEGDARVETGVRRHEPVLALFSGSDGLNFIRRLVAESPSYLVADGLLAFELGAGQRAAVAELLEHCGYRSIRFVADLQGHPRVVLARSPRLAG